MKYLAILNWFSVVLFWAICSESFAKNQNTVDQKLIKGTSVIAGVPVEVWGSYEISPVLFKGEEWKFYIVVVPKDIKKDALIKVAKEFYSKHPETRVRFFSDKTHIQQFVDRDIFYNDRTGYVEEVAFPSDEWVIKHFVGNINNRSQTYHRAWMLEDRYGSKISFLP